MNGNNDVVRIYPIRTTRNQWKIPLYCRHKCGDHCQQVFIQDSDDQTSFILTENPHFHNGKCPKNEQLERSYVRMVSFDLENPNAGQGLLHDPDKIVIPDNKIYIHICYPLNNPMEITVNSTCENGFTLRYILHTIKRIYETIYEEEEQTATPTTHTLQQICDKCNKNIETYMKETKNPPEECCICYNNYKKNKKAVKLDCDHVFHKTCMLQWIERSITCPLCRKNIVTCEKCDGNGFVNFNFDAVVVPLELRGYVLNRNETNGIYGVYGHDLEDLVIEEMMYDRTSKRLHLCIGS